MGSDLIGLIKEKQAQIAKLQTELEEAKAILLNGSATHATTPHVRPLVKKRRNDSSAGKLSSVTGGPTKQQSSTGWAFRVLKESHRPMHINEIVDRIDKLGVKINPGTLVGNLARRVVRRNLFYRDQPNVYGLLEWQKQETRL